MVNHSCIVQYYYIFFEKQEKAKYLFLIMDHYPSSFKSYLKRRKIEKKPIPEKKICLYLYQILNGILHLNELELTHHDLVTIFLFQFFFYNVIKHGNSCFYLPL